MKRNCTFLLLLSVAILTTASCHKNNGTSITGTTAGTDGTTTLVLLPQHHSVSWAIDTCKVYIKYNATDGPINGMYDDSVTCTCADSTVTCSFKNLKNGSYYLYGRGYDSNVHYQLAGGMPITITKQNMTSTIDLAIVEY